MKVFFFFNMEQTSFSSCMTATCTGRYPAFAANQMKIAISRMIMIFHYKDVKCNERVHKEPVATYLSAVVCSFGPL
jgi:hypothetical protein